MKKKALPSHEMEIDPTTIMYADLSVSGTMYEITNERFIYYIEGTMEVNIWESLPTAYQDYYRSKFIEFHKCLNDQSDRKVV